MTVANRWRLPDGIDEVLPTQAKQVEHARRELLDYFSRWGYELVIPPLMEYTDSLLLDLGADVDLFAFKLTDQLSGKTMAIRPDITPQVARIDAHSLKREGAVRLCYAGSVLHTKAKSLLASRSPIQIGAELFGCEGLQGDIEIISLMLGMLDAAGIEGCHLDLGHVGIYRAIVAASGLNQAMQVELFDALQRKASAEINALLAQVGINEKVAGQLRALVTLNGDRSVLDEARTVLAGVPAAMAALDELVAVADVLMQRYPSLVLHFDLSELRGYEYHTGLVFAALAPGYGQALTNGGRYDDIGAAFGRSRAATGFSADLRALVQFASFRCDGVGAIFVPYAFSQAAWHEIQRLRATGETVVCALDDGHLPDERCDRVLRADGDKWLVESLKA
jgi:ATP phosphoribosyltransferase regulatory subunit